MAILGSARKAKCLSRRKEITYLVHFHERAPVWVPLGAILAELSQRGDYGLIIKRLFSYVAVYG